MIRFAQDENGSGSPIEFVLLLPLFIVLLVGVYQVWEVISIRESLDRGVLQAAEYWSTCLPLHGGASTNCREAAEAILRRELANNAILRSRASAGQLDAEDLIITYKQQRYEILSGLRPVVAPTLARSDPDDWPVFHPFAIEARLAVPWAVQIPFLPPQRIALTIEHVTFKEKPYAPPTPTPSPTNLSASRGKEANWGRWPTLTPEAGTWATSPTPTPSGWRNP